MGSHSELPPQWVDIYDDTVEKLKQVKEIRNWSLQNLHRLIKLPFKIDTDIEKLSAKRIKAQFGNFSKMDEQINERTHEATKVQ